MSENNITYNFHRDKERGILASKLWSISVELEQSKCERNTASQKFFPIFAFRLATLLLFKTNQSQYQIKIKGAYFLIITEVIGVAIAAIIILFVYDL